MLAGELALTIAASCGRISSGLLWAVEQIADVLSARDGSRIYYGTKREQRTEMGAIESGSPPTLHCYAGHGAVEHGCEVR
jgi:hypothetical protein